MFRVLTSPSFSLYLSQEKHSSLNSLTSNDRSRDLDPTAMAS